MRMFFKILLRSLLSYAFLVQLSTAAPCEHPRYDLVVLGGTGAGYAAAIQAARLNLSVALIEDSAHVGGISIEGAGGSDLDSQVKDDFYTPENPLAKDIHLLTDESSPTSKTH